MDILFSSNKLREQLFRGVEWAKIMCTIIMMYFLGAVGTAWFAWPSWPPRGPRYLCCWDRGLWLIWPQRSPRTGWCSWSTGRSSGNAPFSPFFCLSSNIPQCNHNSHKHLTVFLSLIISNGCTVLYHSVRRKVTSAVKCLYFLLIKYNQKSFDQLHC